MGGRLVVWCEPKKKYVYKWKTWIDCNKSFICKIEQKTYLQVNESAKKKKIESPVS